MKHVSRGTAVFVAVILLLMGVINGGEGRRTAMMAMQQLPREELVRLAGYGEEKLSSVLIMGTVVCHESCTKSRTLGSDFYDSHVAGAKISVACKTQGAKLRSRRTSYAHATTDDYGEFMIDLPSHLHAVPKLEDSCVVKVLQLPRKSPCHKTNNLSINPRKIRLSSVGNGIRVYTAGTVKINVHVHGCLRKREDGMESTW